MVTHHEEETHPILVTYTFQLPEHEYEKKIFDAAPELLQTLEDINQACRKVMKYEENVSDEKYKFAELIREMVSDATWRLE